MIEVKNLKVGVWEKEILKWVSLNFELWKNYCILWKNGSWKSSLASVLAWHPKYQVISWTIIMDNQDLLSMTPEARSTWWLFISFQNIPEIKWINLSEYLRVIYNTHLKNKKNNVREFSPFLFKRFIKKHLDNLHIDEAFLNRELNVWFSWWEKRKIEILQMRLIRPNYIILDEIDSGLDLNAFKTIANILKNLSNNTLIIITHYFKILEFLDIDKVYVFEKWEVVREGDKNLALQISEDGFWE